MIKIAINSDKPDSLRDFYRGMGVFSRLKDFHVQKFNWNTAMEFENYDIIFLSSPVHANNLNIVQYAKDNKIKIWSDFDDDISDCQSDNVAYDSASSPGQIKNMIASIKESDLVTVTTSPLQTKLSRYNKNVHILPNAFNNHVFKLDYNLSKTKIVGWRGAIDGHGRDLVSAIRPLINLDNLFEESGWTFSFNGKNPWYVTDYIKNWTRTGEMPFYPFMENFRKINPAIFIYPLVDCSFNRCKSQLAWMDATYAGSACVVPDFEVYEKIPVLKYVDEQSFEDAVLFLMASDEKRKELYENSIQHLTENYLLTNINKERAEMVTWLL